MEARSYNAVLRSGRTRPFEPDAAVAITSHRFAHDRAHDIARAPWDLVIIDEAHRRGNVWKPGNVVAGPLKEALGGLGSSHIAGVERRSG